MSDMLSICRKLAILIVLCGVRGSCYIFFLACTVRVSWGYMSSLLCLFDLQGKSNRKRNHCMQCGKKMGLATTYSCRLVIFCDSLGQALLSIQGTYSEISQILSVHFTHI